MEKRHFRRILDITLTLLLGAQMAYALIGEAAHEIMGMAWLMLLILHHVVNGGFHRKLFKGGYTPYRAALTLLDLAMLGIFIMQGVSGMVMAKHVRLLPVSGAAWARKAHLLGAYWGFVLCGVHAGMHMTGLLRLWHRAQSGAKKACIACAALGLGACGVVAMVKRGLLKYMILRQQFVFLDYSEPLWRFFLDYALILLLWMLLGCMLGAALRRVGGRKKR